MTRGPSVADPTGQTRLLSEPCLTCIFRPGNKMHLNPGRVAAMVGQAHADESFIVCHKTLPGEAPPRFRPAVCRGFYDRFSTAALQVAYRMWGYLVVTLPGMPEPSPEPLPEPGHLNPGRIHMPPEIRRRRRRRTG